MTTPIQTTDADRPCPHVDFEAQVEVNRLFKNLADVEDEATAIPDGYVAEIRIRCCVCDEQFTWIGPEVGLRPDRPTIDPTAQELRAPIRPRSSEPDFGLGLPGFQVRHHD